MADSQHPNPNQWWYHRRVMAYASLGGLFSILIALFAGGIRTDAAGRISDMPTGPVAAIRVQTARLKPTRLASRTIVAEAQREAVKMFFR